MSRSLLNKGARINTGKLLVCRPEYPRTNRTTGNTFLDIADMWGVFACRCLGARPFHWFLEIWYGRLIFLLVLSSNIDALWIAQCMIEPLTIITLWYVIKVPLFKLWSINKKKSQNGLSDTPAPRARITQCGEFHIIQHPYGYWKQSADN